VAITGSERKGNHCPRSVRGLRLIDVDERVGWFEKRFSEILGDTSDEANLTLKLLLNP